MKIAYLTSKYPAVSHTFILREIHALRALGAEISTFSVRRPDRREILGLDAEQEANSTRFLVPPSVMKLAIAILWAATTRPLAAVRRFAAAVLNPGLPLSRRIKWLCYFTEAILLARWLVVEEFDHLHCHFGNNGTSTGMLAAQLAGIPFSFTVHGSELHQIKEQRLCEKVARAAFVACVSQHGRSRLMLACPPEHWDKLHLVRCGITPIHSSCLAQREGKLRILCVGRLSLEKGHLILLDALAGLRDRGVEFHCTLVGDGPMRRAITSRTEELHLSDALTFAGSLEPDQVADAYQLSDVVALASLSEGVPIVLMEAMDRGLPVVATRVGGVPELVEHGHSGLLVPPGDHDAITEALLTIHQAPDWARNLGEEGSRRVKEFFDISTTVRPLLELFGQVNLTDSSKPTKTPIESTGRSGASSFANVRPEPER